MRGYIKYGVFTYLAWFYFKKAITPVPAHHHGHGHGHHEGGHHGEHHGSSSTHHESHSQEHGHDTH